MGGKENVKLFLVEDRTKETLQAIIQKHVAKGSKIWHDGWKAYNAIDWDTLEIDHEETKHYP